MNLITSVNLMLFVGKKKKNHEIKVGPESWRCAEQDKALGCNCHGEIDGGAGEDVRAPGEVMGVPPALGWLEGRDAAG